MKKYALPEFVVDHFSDLDLSAHYTYAQYLKWKFEERVELIKGKVFSMSLAPSRMHQKISQSINHYFLNFLLGKTCEVYTAPFDVRLPDKGPLDEDIVTVVQPDLCVICDLSKLDEKGCLGAPDIVVEILSAGNNRKELKDKYELYESAGIREYWIVSPENKSLLQYIRNREDKFEGLRIKTVGDVVNTDVLPRFSLNLSKIFSE
ncbi:MAG: Uma2 family endonuclease [Cyclobacteriaceae bacterium]|nr:Uma2 family endonuclease [Cyclobacteriaceae bacterium]